MVYGMLSLCMMMINVVESNSPLLTSYLETLSWDEATNVPRYG